jgi:hypothetical protein
MKRKILVAFLLLALPTLAQTDSQWVLSQSTLTYHVSHPLHQTDGVSHAARGKGVCHAGQCDFLIAVPVNSFDSGDSNRDLHMVQATRGGQFPMVSVRTRLPEVASASPTCRSGDPICRPDRSVQTGSLRANETRERDEDIRNNSRRHVGLQDRLPVALNDRREERNTGARGNDLAAGEVTWLLAAPVNPKR